MQCIFVKGFVKYLLFLELPGTNTVETVEQ